MQIVDQETPLRRWWRAEAWMDLAEDPTIPTVPIEQAIGLAEWVAQPMVFLDKNVDYTGYLHAFRLAQPWDESYPELLMALATGSLHTKTPLSAIEQALEMVYLRSVKRELCIRARRNQGGLALMKAHTDEVFLFTRDVLALLPEADSALRPGVEVTVYMQRSLALLYQRDYSQAFFQALHATTLASNHAGRRPLVDVIYAHMALCAALDDRLEMAEAWLERVAQPTTEGQFARGLVLAVLQWRRGDAGALETAKTVLSLWPEGVNRRAFSQRTWLLVEAIEAMVASRGVSPHDIDPNTIWG